MPERVIADYWLPILQAYHTRQTALPLYLGLGESRFLSLLEAIDFPTTLLPEDIESGLALRLELMEMRISELDELEALLIDYLSPDALFGKQMVRVLASACLGSQHLWHDLGMPERPRLTALFGDYFPQLRSLNVNNMRWKRFLYRQLCERGGDYVCRSPSCEECPSYNECFDVKE